MSLHLVRAFVKLRETSIVHRDLIIKMDELENRVGGHDEKLRTVFEALRCLMAEPEKPKRRIGFTAEEKRATYAVAVNRRV